MAKYSVFVSGSAEKALVRLPKKDIAKIAAAIRALADDPRPSGCNKLSGEDSVFRIRLGHYRVIYEVRDKRLFILVLKIGNRKDVYR